MTPMECLAEFHKAYNISGFTPAHGSLQLSKLSAIRRTLIEEEAMEVEEALAGYSNDSLSRMHLAKELADLLYVTYGTAELLGINLEEAFLEVHKSNMSKLDAYGNPVYRSDGKVLKGHNYRPPDLARFV